MTTPSPAKPPPVTRVYIVDDHDLVRLGLNAIIAGQPDLAICGQTASYAQAMKEIPTLNPDLALIDLTLKDGSGLELIRSLHRLQPNMRLCVFSAHEETVYAQRMLRAGASGYLMKGEAPDRVLTTIRRIAAGHKVVSDRVVATLLDPLTGRLELQRSNSLTDRELEIVELYGSGESTERIAARLHLSLKTIEHHRTRIRRKFNLTSGADFIRFCVLWGKDQPNGEQPPDPAL